MPDRAVLRAMLRRELYGEVPELCLLESSGQVICEHSGDFLLHQRFYQNPFGEEIDVLTAEPLGETVGHIVGINFGGNHTLSSIPSIPLARTWTSPWSTKRADELSNEADRNMAPDAFPLERIVRAGFKVSTFYSSDILPDRVASLKSLRQINSTLGAIGFWGWGLASVAHTIEQRLPITFVGHSRFGKAALCAACLFDVASAVVPIQAGTGGTAPMGTLVGETVEQLTERFPHWFHPSLKSAYGLSFDTDSIFAACQPARILILGADEDTWADPEGAARMLDRAQDREWVGLDSRSVIRRGTHRVTLEDWDEIIRFLSN
jgi:hypothetical protein